MFAEHHIMVDHCIVDEKFSHLHHSDSPICDTGPIEGADTDPACNHRAKPTHLVGEDYVRSQIKDNDFQSQS